MRDLPTGGVTFLFTDIEGSTQLFQRHPDAMRAAMTRHLALLQSAIDAYDGAVFHVVGDAVCAAFASADAATRAALAAQRALHSEPWGDVGELRVRMGIHSGAAEVNDGEYVSSLTLARAQRVTTAGHGGQTLLSQTAAAAVRANLPDGTTLRDLGTFKLRGLAEGENIFELVAADLPSDFPPLRVEDSASPSAAPLHELIGGRLVGRATELQQLVRHWDQAHQARGHLALLSGEPGVGKTRIARELISHAQAAGATILRGGCYENEATTPYLPFVEAIRDWVHWQTAAQLRTMLGATAPEIAKFAPEIEAKLGAIAPNPALSPNEERLRLFDNVARFLQSLAAARGLVVFTDDLHWADQGSLSLLHYLLRSLKGSRVLFLAAYRELELDRAHPLASALVEWNRERLATRVQLGRLSRADTNALLATLFGVDAVSDDFAGALYRETEGNPFFVEEVVKALIEQGQIYRQDGGWGRKDVHDLAIPQSVKEAIGRRLTRLSEGAADTLRTAAALGKSFGFRELAAVSSADENALLDALDEASSAQLIREASGAPGSVAPGDDRFVFTHDKIREVLYEEMNPIRRRRLHLRIGEALEQLSAGPLGSDTWNSAQLEVGVQDLAHHFMQAGDFAKSLTYLRSAAENAARVFAHDDALKFLEQARESADALRRDDDIALVDEQIGDVHTARGTVPTAIEAYERALAGSRLPATRATLKVKLGNAYSPVGDPRGLAHLEAVLPELDPQTQTNALAHATALIGRYYHYRTQHRKAIEYLERARLLAEPLDDPGTLTDVYGYLAGAHQHLLQLDESDNWSRRSIAIGERRQFPAAIAMGYEFLSENACTRGHWDEAIAFARRDRAEGLKIGSMARVAWSGFPMSQGLYGQGALAETRAEALATMQLSEQLGEARLSTWLDPALAVYAADMGDDATAAFHAERGWTRARDLGQRVLSAWALMAHCNAAIQRDDIPAALDWQAQYVALLTGTENLVVSNMGLARAAEANLRAGRIDEAARLAGDALAIAEFGKLPHYAALARAMRGRIALASGDGQQAISTLDEAIAGFTAIGSRLELARARFHLASAYLNRSNRDAARVEATLAHALFVETGATREQARAEALLNA